VKQAVTSLLHKFDTDLYAEIQTLVQQYEKWLQY
jgi:hypothetical protein